MRRGENNPGPYKQKQTRLERRLRRAVRRVADNQAKLETLCTQWRAHFGTLPPHLDEAVVVGPRSQPADLDDDRQLPLFPPEKQPK